MLGGGGGVCGVVGGHCCASPQSSLSGDDPNAVKGPTEVESAKGEDVDWMLTSSFPFPTYANPDLQNIPHRNAELSYTHTDIS